LVIDLSATAESFHICARPYLESYIDKGVASDFSSLPFRSTFFDLKNRGLEEMLELTVCNTWGYESGIPRTIARIGAHWRVLVGRDILRPRDERK
jgi:hypothetical protein